MSDHEQIERDIHAVERSVRIVVMVVNCDHPPVEAGHDLEKGVAAESDYQHLIQAVAQLHLSNHRSSRQRREDVIETFDKRQQPYRNCFVAAELDSEPFRQRGQRDDSVGQIKKPFILFGDPAVFVYQNAKNGERHPAEGDKNRIITYQTVLPLSY